MAERTQLSLPAPLLVPALAWCIGIGLGTVVHLPLLWLTGLSLLVLVAGLILRFRLPVIMLIFLLAGFIRLQIGIDHKPEPLQKILAQREHIIHPCNGEIIRVLNPDSDVYLVKLESIDAIHTTGRALLFTSNKLVPGDRFRALAEITARNADPALGDISFYQKQLERKVPLAIYKVYRMIRLPARQGLNLERLRYHLLQRLDGRLGEAAPFTKALLFNDRTEDREWIQQLVQGGLIHLIAISGMNIVFLYIVIVTLLHMVLPRRTAELVFVLLMLVYAGLCQWSPPVMRAIIMILLYLVAKWLQRPVSPLQLVCLSLLMITMFDPVQLFSVGLQLSYLCVLTLLLVMPKSKVRDNHLSPLKKKVHRWSIKFRDFVMASVIISLVMVPIMMYYFQRASLNSIPGTVLGVPLMWFLLPLSLALLVLPSGWFIYDWLKASFLLLHKSFELLVKLTASLPFYIDTTTISLTWMLVIYLIMGAILVRWKGGIRLRWASYALLLLVLPLSTIGFLPHSRSFTLTAFNAGQGDCILVQYPRGQTLMIDTGPLLYDKDVSKIKSWFGTKSRAWQRHRGITNIDLLILSHSDADHSGGLADVLTDFNVRNILLSSATARSAQIKAVQAAGLLKKTNLSILTDTLSFDFGGSRLAVLYPSKEYANLSGNDGSMVVRLDYTGFSALFAGDIPTTIEQYLVATIPDKLDADWLKAPHHGSRFSNSAEFIKAVSPRQVVITAALSNRFGFPSPQVITRYRDYGLQPRITGQGSVIITLP